MYGMSDGRPSQLSIREFLRSDLQLCLYFFSRRCVQRVVIRVRNAVQNLLESSFLPFMPITLCSLSLWLNCLRTSLGIACRATSLKRQIVRRFGCAGLSLKKGTIMPSNFDPSCLCNSSNWPWYLVEVGFVQLLSAHCLRTCRLFGGAFCKKTRLMNTAENCWLKCLNETRYHKSRPRPAARVADLPGWKGSIHQRGRLLRPLDYIWTLLKGWDSPCFSDFSEGPLSVPVQTVTSKLIESPDNIFLESIRDNLHESCIIGIGRQ